ncbi:hypothetical protein [Solemya velum gill symbiont]|uniref:hypothetical protein n=1 Tax=Solemya velum gill symbiont TaxID=2340 RepID=UPI0021190DAD|nr:hypothetical protein [Solemya velum gill symbiont]
MLDVKQSVADGIQERFDLESVGEQLVSHAVDRGVVRLHGKDHNVAELVDAVLLTGFLIRPSPNTRPSPMRAEC